MCASEWKVQLIVVDIEEPNTKQTNGRSKLTQTVSILYNEQIKAF